MPPKKARFENRGGKGGKGKVKAGAMTTAATPWCTETMTAMAMDHSRTGDATDTATGEAAMAAPPGTTMAHGALALGDHLRPTHEAGIALSHR